MAKAKKLSIMERLKSKILPTALSALLFALIITAYQNFVSNKYYPQTSVGDINISFLTEGQAIKKVDSIFQKRTQQKLTFKWAQGAFTIDLATSSASLDYSALESAFDNTHQAALWNQIKTELQTLLFPTLITPKITLSLDKQLNNIADAVGKDAQNAQLVFSETPNPESSASANIQIVDGINGLELNKNQVEKAVTNFLIYGKYKSQLSLKVVAPTVTTSHVTQAKKALEKTDQNPIKLVFSNKSWAIDAKQLLALLNLTDGQGLLLDKEQTASYLKNIASEIDQPVQEGLFEFNPTSKRVTAFKPSQMGRKLDLDKTYQLLNDSLASQGEALERNAITLPVETVKPKIETSDVNSLGIKELLGRGISNFAGSIPNRIYNIALTASKINGVLIPPGQVFSFNQTVGDISAATGFKQAYVIKEGRTVLDDGGGVCQDSTTLFRAVLNAGLPVMKRTAHAYRVGYYEQGFPPGLDATVFYPSVDFQFKNDTPAHILIQAYTSGTTLYVDLYGSPDGREVTLTRPVIANQTPPPPELRQDDPTLPKGTVKQVDWAAWGASVSFQRTVTKNGETIANETWRSNYKPWQAVFLVGTQ
ncbi:VanW family protein [Candidatus Daviesbacteria bacterium]|nr:VanW family protein [Candidatus Daviesbacteria bacterium]